MTDLLKEWQDRLGLQEWKVNLIDKCKPRDFRMQDCDGECEYNEVLKMAIVRLMDPVWMDGDEANDFDAEKVLVHELLHIKFCLLDESDNPLQNRIVHQMVDDFARALISAKRDGRACSVYRIKPEGLKHRPYNNTAEMIEDFKQRFNVNNPPYVMPLIWLKNKTGQEEEISLITTFGKPSVFVDYHETMQTLFNEYTYLDDSPVGKLVEE